MYLTSTSASPIKEEIDIRQSTRKLQESKKTLYYDESRAFSKQLSPALLGHFTISYKINKKRTSHEFAIKVLNATGYKEYNGYRYNFKTQNCEPEKEATVIPNISYKIEF